MSFVGTGITAEGKCDAIIENATCPNCRNAIQAPMLRIVQAGSVIGVTVAKSTMIYYTKCPCCGMEYRMKKDVYESVLQSASPEALFYQCSMLLQSAKDNEAQYQQKSKRSWGLSLLLAIVGGIFGLQHWYMGFKNRGLISLGLLIGAIGLFFAGGALGLGQGTAILPAICIAINVYWGLLDGLRILLGKAKDADQKYIMTQKQHQIHLDNWKQFR